MIRKRIVKQYEMKDLHELKKKNDHLMKAVLDMIEVGVYHGDYDKSVLQDQSFIDAYLLEEINSGFIRVFNHIK